MTEQYPNTVSEVVCKMSDHTPQSSIVDVLIVGGNVAGLSAGLVLGRARKKVLLLDTGFPSNRYSGTAHTYPGMEGQKPRHIVEQMR